MPRARAGPLVSVIIAAFGRPAVLRYAIASALRQSYGHFELLVVGDACPHGSAEVTASFADRRISWHQLEHNSGSQAGPNQAGLERAQGAYVAYLGQDDLWMRDHLGLLVADMRASASGATSTVADYVWPGRPALRRLVSPVPGSYVPPSAFMHERRAGLAAGGWRPHRETIDTPDVDFLARLARSGTAFSRVRALGVVKLPSSLRPGSYRDARSDEQRRYAARMDRASFTAGEVLAAAAAVPWRPWTRTPFIDPRVAAQPGGKIDEYRRIRGLGRP